MREEFDKHPKHKNAYHSHDTWHFLREWEKELEALKNTRVKKWAREFLYKQLREKFESGKMSVYKFKSWFYNCVAHIAAMGSTDAEKVAEFEQRWRGMSAHYELTGEDKVHLNIDNYD
jgi:hypothetical protein